MIFILVFYVKYMNKGLFCFIFVKVAISSPVTEAKVEVDDQEFYSKNEEKVEKRKAYFLKI